MDIINKFYPDLAKSSHAVIKALINQLTLDYSNTAPVIPTELPTVPQETYSESEYDSEADFEDIENVDEEIPEPVQPLQGYFTFQHHKTLKFKNAIFNKAFLLDQIFENIPHPREYMHSLPLKLPAKATCERLIRYKESYVKCIDCFVDKNTIACICMKCFENSNHTGHRTQIKRNEEKDEFATCDCGEYTLWAKSGMCSEHGHEYNQKEVEKLLEDFPKNVKVQDVLEHAFYGFFVLSEMLAYAESHDDKTNFRFFMYEFHMVLHEIFSTILDCLEVSDSLRHVIGRMLITPPSFIAYKDKSNSAPAAITTLENLYKALDREYSDELKLQLKEVLMSFITEKTYHRELGLTIMKMLTIIYGLNFSEITAITHWALGDKNVALAVVKSSYFVNMNKALENALKLVIEYNEQGSEEDLESPRSKANLAKDIVMGLSYCWRLLFKIPETLEYIIMQTDVIQQFMRILINFEKSLRKFTSLKLENDKVVWGMEDEKKIKCVAKNIFREKWVLYIFDSLLFYVYELKNEGTKVKLFESLLAQLGTVAFEYVNGLDQDQSLFADAQSNNSIYKPKDNNDTNNGTDCHDKMDIDLAKDKESTSKRLNSTITLPITRCMSVAMRLCYEFQQNDQTNVFKYFIQHAFSFLSYQEALEIMKKLSAEVIKGIGFFTLIDMRDISSRSKISYNRASSLSTYDIFFLQHCFLYNQSDDMFSFVVDNFFLNIQKQIDLFYGKLKPNDKLLAEEEVEVNQLLAVEFMRLLLFIINDELSYYNLLPDEIQKPFPSKAKHLGIFKNALITLLHAKNNYTALPALEEDWKIYMATDPEYDLVIEEICDIDRLSKKIRLKQQHLDKYDLFQLKDVFDIKWTQIYNNLIETRPNDDHLERKNMAYNIEYIPMIQKKMFQNSSLPKWLSTCESLIDNLQYILRLINMNLKIYLADSSIPRSYIEGSYLNEEFKLSLKKVKDEVKQKNLINSIDHIFKLLHECETRESPLKALCGQTTTSGQPVGKTSSEMDKKTLFERKKKEIQAKFELMQKNALKKLEAQIEIEAKPAEALEHHGNKTHCQICHEEVKFEDLAAPVYLTRSNFNLAPEEIPSFNLTWSDASEKLFMSDDSYLTLNTCGHYFHKTCVNYEFYAPSDKEDEDMFACRVCKHISNFWLGLETVAQSGISVDTRLTTKINQLNAGSLKKPPLSKVRQIAALSYLDEVRKWHIQICKNQVFLQSDLFFSKELIIYRLFLENMTAYLKTLIKSEIHNLRLIAWPEYNIFYQLKSEQAVFHRFKCTGDEDLNQPEKKPVPLEFCNVDIRVHFSDCLFYYWVLTRLLEQGNGGSHITISDLQKSYLSLCAFSSLLTIFFNKNLIQSNNDLQFMIKTLIASKDYMSELLTSLKLYSECLLPSLIHTYQTTGVYEVYTQQQHLAQGNSRTAKDQFTQYLEVLFPDSIARNPEIFLTEVMLFRIRKDFLSYDSIMLQMKSPNLYIRKFLFKHENATPMIKLPDTFHDFSVKYTKEKCFLHNGLSSNLIICLLCGSAMCLQCKDRNFKSNIDEIITEDDFEDYPNSIFGNMQEEKNIRQHAAKKHCGRGLFLRVIDLKTYFLDGKYCEIDETQIYVDGLGQGVYDNYKRIKQDNWEKFRVNSELYDKFARCVLHNKIRQEIMHLYNRNRYLS